MPDRTRFLPNERVELEDLRDATVGNDDASAPGYAEASERRLADRLLLASLPAVAEGFRVEIPNQTTNPGQFTIHNGFAFARDGRILEDEADRDDQKSATLPLANTQYFLEVEMVISEGAADARAFWDPTFDNGQDPSGDVRPAGREYSSNVATDWTPSWRIVTPVSTTDFAINSDPDSARIPIATLQTNGATQITGATTAAARSILRDAVAIAAVEIPVVSSRIFPDTFTLRLNPGGATQEDVTVTSNDRANHVLTVAVGPASEHAVGERCSNVSAGAPVFLAEREAAGMPTAGSADARLRLWRGDAAAGMPLVQDPAAAAGESAVQIASLKQYVDALAAELRDLKFGGMLDADTTTPLTHGVGQSAPPSSFAANPPWWERAGGVLGARTNTVSVGDGTSTFGDFNVNAHASAQACLQAAVDALGGNGGIVFVKRGTYSIGATSVTCVARTVFVGEGTVSNIQATSANVPAIVVDKTTVIFQDIQVSRTATTGFALEVSNGNGAVHGIRATIHGIESPADIILNSYFERSLLDAPAGTDGIGISGRLSNCEFIHCTLSTAVNAAGSRAASLATSSANVRFRSCTLTTDGAAITAVLELASSCTDIVAEDCTFTVTGGTATVGCLAAASCARIRLSRCLSATAPAGLLAGTNVTSAAIEHCTVIYGPDENGIELSGATANKGPYTIRSCQFTQSSTGGAKIGTAILLDAVRGVLVDDCRVNDCDRGIVATGGIESLTVRNTQVIPLTATFGHTGIDISGITLANVLIADCEIRGLDDVSAGVSRGIRCSATIGPSGGISVVGNRVSAIGGATATLAEGIRVEGSGLGTKVERNWISGLTADAGGGDMIGIEIAAVAGVIPENVHVVDNEIRSSVADATLTGIHLPAFNRATVRGNIVDALGDAGVTGLVAGILVGDLATGTADQFDLDISGNTISNLLNNGGTVPAMIRAQTAAERVTIASNRGISAQADTYGITLWSGGAGSAQTMAQIAVVGNIMVGSGASTLTNGVSISAQETSDAAYQVIGNTLTNIAATGISVSGGGGDYLTISGNIVDSGNTPVNGIAITDVTGAAIMGNVVRLTSGAGNNTGILVQATAGGTDVNTTIGGNSVYVNNVGTGYGIRVDANSEHATIVGNTVDVDGSPNDVVLQSAVGTNANNHIY